MTTHRNRLLYLTKVLLVVGLGLGSRLDFWPRWVHLYVGDVLWALMVFLIIAMIFKRKSINWVAAVAISFSFSFLIEFSQLYQATWINIIRHTTLGGLVLGYGFLWTDLFLYVIGVCIGVLFEKLIYL
jgi:glycopeptide antibiotics resistance protein